MMRKKKKIERAAIVALAVWLAVLSACVHGVHRHPGGGVITEADAGRASCAFHEPAVITSRSGFQLHLVDASETTSYAKVDYCSACLLLKNFNQRAVVWSSHLADIKPRKQIINPDVRVYASAVITATAPRAPPVSAS